MRKNIEKEEILFDEFYRFFGSITNFVGFPIPLVALSAHIE